MKKVLMLTTLCILWLQAEVIQLTDKNYKENLKSHKSVALLFTAPWCGACRAMKPNYKEFTVKNSKSSVLFTQINTDENEEITSLYKIKSLPTLVMVENGKEIKRISGTLDTDELHIFVNTQKAVEEYMKKCDAGQADACIELGDMYEDSELLKRDYGKALTLYEKSCKLNNAKGCMYLGYMYDEAMGVKQDYPTALKYYTKACKGENTIACRFLGYMYDEGHGTKKDYKKAFHLYVGACKDKDEYACNNLGYMYEAGHGLEKDLKKALHFYELSCKYGYDDACSEVKNLKSK